MPEEKEIADATGTQMPDGKMKKLSKMAGRISIEIYYDGKDSITDAIDICTYYKFLLEKMRTRRIGFEKSHCTGKS